MKDIGVEVYKDVLGPAVSEVGVVVGRSVKALLAPIRGLLWGWDRIEEYVENELQKRLEKIPEKQIKSPDPEIAVPLLESLTYTAQNKTLRELYIALLANAMDRRREGIVHPSYVEIIKKMSRIDAVVFEYLANIGGNIMVVNPRVTLSGTSKYLATGLPEWYLGCTIEEYDEFAISASLVRLSKFGIIELMYDRKISGANYEALKHTPFLKKMLSGHNAVRPQALLEIESTESAVFVNEYGRQFRDACK